MKIKDKSGFTLVELLVVIALIGALLIMVMVNFNRGNHSTDLRAASNSFMQDLRKAQTYSISGNSVNYCDNTSTNHKYYPCQDDDWCGGNVGEYLLCKSSVPGGGYGIMIDSTENYLLFGDTYFVDDQDAENTESHNFFDDNIMDLEITNINFTLDGIHIKEYKLGNEPVVVPNNTIDNRLDILFDVPAGATKFYKVTQEAVDGSGQLINILQILISSDHVANSCRKITINRITGQISESQSACNL